MKHQNTWGKRITAAKLQVFIQNAEQHFAQYQQGNHFNAGYVEKEMEPADPDFVLQQTECAHKACNEQQADNEQGGITRIFFQWFIREGGQYQKRQQQDTQDFVHQEYDEDIGVCGGFQPGKPAGEFQHQLLDSVHRGDTGQTCS